MKKIVIFPYKMTSESAKLLAADLDAKRVYSDRDYSPGPDDLIVNWGSGHVPSWGRAAEQKSMILNHWHDVDKSINKITSFAKFRLAKVSTPDWTRNHSEALEWAADGEWVCCRTQVEGMDGSGLVLAKRKQDVIQSSLYTKYIKIAHEYRVYVFGDTIIDVLEKRRDSEALAAGKVNPDIRTEANHWVFCRSNVHYPMNDQGPIKAVAALGLHFAGVDVVMDQQGKTYILETNTAPGIGGATVKKFSASLAQLAEEIG